MDQKPFFKWPWKRQHGMKQSSGSDHVTPCNLGHGSVLSAVTGEMSSAALFSLAHKFCRVLIQFYGAGTGLFKTLCLWSVSAAGPNTFLWTSLRRPQPNYSFKQTLLMTTLLRFYRQHTLLFPQHMSHASRPATLKQVWCVAFFFFAQSWLSHHDVSLLWHLLLFTGC